RGLVAPVGRARVAVVTAPLRAAGARPLAADGIQGAETAVVARLAVGLELAGRRAAVAGDAVAVVALLSRIDVAVAACSHLAERDVHAAGAPGTPGHSDRAVRTAGHRGHLVLRVQRAAHGDRPFQRTTVGSETLREDLAILRPGDDQVARAPCRHRRIAGADRGGLERDGLREGRR